MAGAVMVSVGEPAVTPVAVDMTNCVPFVMLTIVSPAGILALPVTGMPTYSPAVLVTVTVAEAAVVVAGRPVMLPDALLSGAPMVIGEVVAVSSAFVERTKCVASVMLATVVPSGMPRP